MPLHFTNRFDVICWDVSNSGLYIKSLAEHKDARAKPEIVGVTFEGSNVVVSSVSSNS